MKILTNEYACNTPNFDQPAKGGPANLSSTEIFLNKFSNLFSIKKMVSGYQKVYKRILEDLDYKKNKINKPAEDTNTSPLLSA